MVSFLIADDHAITRLGIIAYIKENFPSLYYEQAEDGDEIFEHLKKRPFDLLITDIGMPGTDAYRLIETALLIRPELKILILSVNKEELFAANYLKKGALGYVEKNLGSEEILKAIRTVLQGNIYMSPALKKSIISGGTQDSNNPFLKLSDRELEISQLLCDGKSVTEIANLLNLGVSTVGTHKAKIFSKLGVMNMVEFLKVSQNFPLSA